MRKPLEPTDRQKKLLAKEDWRFHAIDAVGTGLGSIATTELIGGKIISFSLPSAPALFLSLARRAHERRVAIPVDAAFIKHPPPQGTWPEDHREVFDFFEVFVAETIFSFTAVEAFANESIPTTFSYKRMWKGEEEVLQGHDIERAVSLDDKLKYVIPKAHNVASPTGSAAWNKYIELKRVRDRLIHLKSIDRKSSGPEHQTIWGLLMTKRAHNYADTAVDIIAAFPALVNDRRWFQVASAERSKGRKA